MVILDYFVGSFYFTVVHHWLIFVLFLRSCEVLLVDHKGVLRSFFVSPTDGYIPNHKFIMEGGVSTVTYHTSHNIIFVTGLPTTQVKVDFSNFVYL